MKSILVIALLCVALNSQALNVMGESPRKSFCDAEQECADYLFITNETLERYHRLGYPDEPSVRKLLNCIIVDLNAWDDDQQQIKDYVFNQFFVPNSVDCQYKQRTLECLAQNVTTLDYSDRLGRVYQSFQCYNLNYAGVSCELQWLPLQRSEIEQIFYDCMQMVALSNDTLLEYCQGRFKTSPDFKQLGYCFFLRGEFYNRNTGVNMKNMYTQLGINDFLGNGIGECLSRATSQHCTELGRFERIWQDCFMKYFPRGHSVLIAASRVLGNPPVCGIPPREPLKTQPCYNGLCE